MNVASIRSSSQNQVIALVIGAVLLAPLLIYFDTARSIVSIWNSSGTFAHGYIIFPISMWLIWQRRRTLNHAPLVPFWPALLVLAGCGFGWLLAELGDVQVVRQYAFVAMIPLAVIAVAGLRISWSLAFPLFFLLLAVPFGEIFIAPLINVTADFTVAALQLTGIPVLRDGPNFSIPSGDWSVVEACSGVRYLIASFTLGCLYAYVTYRSWVRRATFIVLSILVPIAANGMRAYMIVMIGHLSGMELATGVDHLIYGWLFFGLVMFIMYWVGSFWREDQTEHTAGESMRAGGDAEESRFQSSGSRVLAAAVAAVICMGIWPAFAKYVEVRTANPAPADLAGFRANWSQAEAFTDWRPSFSAPNAELSRFYRQDDKKAGLSLLYYRNQGAGSTLISSANRLVPDGENHAWRKGATSLAQVAFPGRDLVVRETSIRGPSGSMLVWHWYWIGERFIANDYVGKMLQTKEKFLMKGDDGAAVFAYALYSENPEEARTVLREFLLANLPSLESTLATNKQH